MLVFDAHRGDVRGDDNAEIEAGEQIHRLVAVDEALHQLMVRIGALRIRESGMFGEQAGGEQHDDHDEQQGAHHLAEHLRQLVGMLGHEERQAEEHQ